MTPAIEVRNVSWGVKGVAGGLDRLSLSVPRGQCLVLGGGAGSGKATLLRLIARDLPPRSGAVCLFSRDIWLMSAEEVAATVTVLSPADTAFDGMTPWQIVGAACRDARRDPSPAARSAAIHAALRQVGLAGMRDPAFGQLPAGDRLRVLVARLLVLRPQILLLPDAAEGEALRLQIGLLGALRDAGATVVMTAEHAESSAGLADRVVELDRGRIVADSAAGPAMMRAG